MPRQRFDDPARRDFLAGCELVKQSPLFAVLLDKAIVVRGQGTGDPDAGWLRVRSHGEVVVNAKRRETPEGWAYALAHALLHLGLGHFIKHDNPSAWSLACDIAIHRFLADLRFATPPAKYTQRTDPFLSELPAGDENAMYEALCGPLTNRLPSFGLAGDSGSDLMIEPDARVARWRKGKLVSFPDALAAGLQRAVQSAVSSSAETNEFSRSSDTAHSRNSRMVARAREWFVLHYPLLGALAASFDFVTDPQIAVREGISIAAVYTRSREIVINAVMLPTEEQLRFVIAHEMLHVALHTGDRARGRDAYLWNVASDFVINGWLVEMGVGDMPSGVLYDADLAGLSAESVYDRIVTDQRRMRKIATLRGVGVGDVLDAPGGHLTPGEAVDLDAFYRDALARGLALHQSEERGLLPAGLIEAIRALAHPPIPWEVELARWMDSFLAPLEKRRTYARPSRRQAAAADISIPRYVSAEPDPGRTFAVVIDTSASMSRVMLGQALGAISSYATARDVGYVRVVSCDAAAYDHGFMAPEIIADRMTLRGRGGTVLQPGIDLIESARDFPPAGPILIITDGDCDAFKVRRKHAVLLPVGRPFPYATGSTSVFRFHE